MITSIISGLLLGPFTWLYDLYMSTTVRSWTDLVLRWTHVFSAILWVGSTYYFTWLDGRLSEEERAAAAGEKAEVWMVHSGGFYVVEKQKKPGKRKLHWFRWEAAMTWLSGMFLLALIYYPDQLADPLDPVVSRGTAVLIGIGVIVVGWIVYDLLSQSPLGKNELVFAAVSYVLLVALIYGLTRVLTERAAYIHVGALFGTLMAANVWMRILPAQRQMIAATKEGKQPDARLAARAKLRSKQNTFMVVPTIFIMLSPNHYASITYGSQYNWIILSVLILVGWGAAKIIRRA
ncbi:MAG TPA: urate hydroxylase PuuD [Pyrinomonadaceae bacterium]